MVVQIVAPVLLVVVIALLPRVLGLPFDTVMLLVVQIVAPVLLVVVIVLLPRVLGLHNIKKSFLWTVGAIFFCSFHTPAMSFLLLFVACICVCLLLISFFVDVVFLSIL